MVASKNPGSADLRQRLHGIIDVLPDEELGAAFRYLEYLRLMRDPLLRALLEAPQDDEPETPEEADAVREAREDLLHGRVVSHEEARRQLLQG